jgi:UDP-N-acetyl-D-mannosaminuronic acid dehydrogenase
LNKFDICVVGGAGHIGAPLAILFASRGFKVLICDPNRKTMDDIQSGKLPFLEREHEPLLKNALEAKNLSFTTNPVDARFAKTLIVCIGTPIDEFHNPKIGEIIKCIDELPINNTHLLILRSTLFPGTTDYVERYLHNKNVFPLISFCPERIVQGEAIKELQKLPQIISGTTPHAQNQASQLFQTIAPEIVHMKPMEAEFAKLFANTYRYIQFATTNQFYEMATIAGLDYHKILQGSKQNYPRLHDLPIPGLTAGPCLFKDVLQLCAFTNGKFMLGQSAINANEGLPDFLVNQLEKKHNLLTKTVGLLGMAFKANSDDARSSLSYKLKKILTFKAKKVLTTDPLVQDKYLLPLHVVIEQSDILIICVPHDQYKNLKLDHKEVVNVWNG